MAKSVLKNYTFNVAGKTITLTDVSTIRLDRLALITDVTTNKILYNFADLTVATATVSTNVITLSALQGGEANGDKLRIDYDVDTADAAFGNTTDAVQVQSSALPTGAATSAKQPALGTAGSASADVLSVQGVASMTPLKVDASATTQPVSLATNTPTLQSGSTTAVTQATGTNLHTVVDSGSVTANVGSTGGLALDATLTTRIPVQGQASMAASVPVTIASNQTAIPVSITSAATSTGTVQPTVVDQQVGGDSLQASAPGVPITTIAGALGDPLDTTGNALNVAVQGTVPVAPTQGTPDIVAKSQLTAVNQFVVAAPFNGMGSAQVHLTAPAAPSATVTPQVTLDGVLWLTVPNFFTWTGPSVLYSTQVGSSGTFVLTAVSHILAWSVAGFTGARLLVTAYTSGTVQATMRVSGAPIIVTPLAAQYVDGLVSAANQVSTFGYSAGYLFNGASADRARSVINATNSIGTGIAAVGLTGQLDDVAPTAITENQFGNVRMSADRGLLVAGINPSGVSTTLKTDAFNNQFTTIRDAAGNARGANVNANNQLSVSVDNAAVISVNEQQVAGADRPVSADGIPFTSLAGPLGDPIDTTGNSINTFNNGGTVGLIAGTAIIGKVGIDQTTQGVTNAYTLLGAGSNTQIKDDSFYGDANTSGLLMTHSRIWNGASYDRWRGHTNVPHNTDIQTYSAQISTNTTTTPTAATAYISSIAISVTAAGTTSTLTIKDKQGTPLTLVNAQATAALSAGDTIYNFQSPVKMVSGIDIVTAGAAAATLSIFITYYQ